VNHFAEFGPVDKLGHCRWCGRALRKKWRTEEAPHTKNWHPPDQHYPDGYASNSSTVPHVKVGEPTLGDYGDGHFCGLRCGYRFGVRLANLGSRLKKGPTP
jgi:hypothetical protein